MATSLLRTRPFHPVFDRGPFDRAFEQLAGSLLASSTGRRTPLMEARSADGALVLTVDAPGTPEEAIAISVAARTLTIGISHDELTWERQVRLGTALDPEQVTARYVDGRLTITVGAAAAAEARSIAVETSPVAAIESTTTTETVDDVDTTGDAQASSNGTSDNR